MFYLLSKILKSVLCFSATVKSEESDKNEEIKKKKKKILIQLKKLLLIKILCKFAYLIDIT